MSRSNLDYSRIRDRACRNARRNARRVTEDSGRFISRDRDRPKEVGGKRTLEESWSWHVAFSEGENRIVTRRGCARVVGGCALTRRAFSLRRQLSITAALPSRHGRASGECGPDARANHLGEEARSQETWASQARSSSLLRRGRSLSLLAVTITSAGSRY